MVDDGFSHVDGLGGCRKGRRAVKGRREDGPGAQSDSRRKDGMG